MEFMLMIRLARFGAKKKPFYRVVVIEKERARNSRNLEVVGHYNPLTSPPPGHAETRSHRVLDQERRPAVRHREAVGGKEPSRSRATGGLERTPSVRNLTPTQVAGSQVRVRFGYHEVWEAG